MDRAPVWERWDEYATGAVTAREARLHPEPCTLSLWSPEDPFRTEGGAVLPRVEVRFETYGPPRREGILIFHALTGSAHVAGTYRPEVLARLSPLEQAFGPRGWWDALVGPGKGIDTEQHFVICANVLGSCYGTTGPLSPDPRTGGPYGPDFPAVTIRDMVRVQARLLDALGVERVLALGGSMGGMLALEFALSYPERTAGVVILAAPARHGPWARALNWLSREAILRDPEYRGGWYRRQPAGLKLARSIAMVSYRAPAGFRQRWDRDPGQGEGYLGYQGEKFLRRFDANAYLTLSRAMDSHDVARGRGELEEVLAALPRPALFVGIDTDLLYPAQEVRELARLARAEYAEIRSPHGHDAFLIEVEQVARILRGFGLEGAFAKR